MHRSLPRHSARTGFTLIEILVVILIIGILATVLLPKIPEAIDQAEVTGCQANMRSIYQGFLTYRAKYEKMPSQSGVRFFADLIAKNVFENTKASAKKMNCPAQRPAGLADMKETEWYVDLEVIDGSYSSYAGRDCNEYPVKSWTGKEPLVGDDNDGGMNHRTTTVVLYGDGTPQTFEIALLWEEGVLEREEEHLVVGPDSPVEDLRKLSLD